MGTENLNKEKRGAIEDIKEGVGILQKIANVLVTVLSIFKSKK